MKQLCNKRTKLWKAESCNDSGKDLQVGTWKSFFQSWF